jgi:hypothetical protein
MNFHQACTIQGYMASTTTSRLNVRVYPLKFIPICIFQFFISKAGQLCKRKKVADLLCFHVALLVFTKQASEIDYPLIRTNFDMALYVILSKIINYDRQNKMLDSILSSIT